MRKVFRVTILYLDFLFLEGQIRIRVKSTLNLESMIARVGSTCSTHIRSFKVEKKCADISESSSGKMIHLCEADFVFLNQFETDRPNRVTGRGLCIYYCMANMSCPLLAILAILK